jgi:4-hydroxybenzoate polyprenyl transferase
MPLAFAYPLMKRFTYWPQLFLGITFNYGLILGWTAIMGEISIVPFIFYLGAIFWTLGFDTIYGFQDIIDDEIIGIKSTSIKFKKNPKRFLFLCYSMLLSSLFFVGFFMNFKYLFYIFLSIAAIQLLFFQIYKLDSRDPKNCLKIFKSNNSLGLIVLINILIGKIII